MQDDASEDPLTAAKAGAAGNGDLIWKNKMLRPLQELFTTCLTPAHLQACHSTATAALTGDSPSFTYGQRAVAGLTSS